MGTFRGGRFYKVGDFKQVDGKWKFVADEAYKNSDGVMNFGKGFLCSNDILCTRLRNTGKSNDSRDY